MASARAGDTERVNPIPMRYLALAAVILTGVGIFMRPEPVPAGPDPISSDGWVVGTSESAVRGVPAPSSAVGSGFEGGAFVEVSEQTYPVTGATEAEVLASMRAGGPSAGGQTYFGLTASESSFQMQPRTDGPSCVAEDVRVELAVTITLPKWEPTDTAPYELQRDWTRFSTALQRHEDGHRQIAAEGAEATHAALKGLRRSSCLDVEFEARQRAQRIAEKTEAEHNRYDAETDHGRTQGAQWPVH